MAQASQRYVAIFSLVSLSAVSAVATLNYLVDPYDIVGRNTLGVYVAADRESRPAFVGRFKPDAVLLGTSKAAMIDTTQLTDYRFCSVTFGGATIEELYSFTKNHLRNLKLAVLALDFWMFGTEPAFIEEDTFAPRNLREYLDYLLSLKTTQDSFQTVSRSLRNKPKAFRADGSYIAEKWTLTKDVPNAAVLESAFIEESEIYRKMRFSRKRMAKLREFRDLLAYRGIRAVVVINPLHQRSAALLANSPMAKQANAWIHEIRSLFPQTVDLSNSIYSSPDNFFAADPIHYKPDTGVRFMEEDVLPTVERFGTKLPPAPKQLNIAPE